MTRTTVFIILDAARSDYVRPDSMPFTHGLAQTGVTASFESPPGFAQRTVMFTGRYPDTSGRFSAFVYDPEGSPFRWVRRLGPLPGLVRPRKLLYPARVALDRATKAFTGAYHTDPAWIPPRFLPFFRPCEDMQPVFEPGALGTTSLFDLCRSNGLTFRYLAHPVSGDDEQVHEWLLRDLRTGAPYDLYVAQFSVTDQKGHTLGPFSPGMQQQVLHQLDDKLASVHAALEAGYDEWDLFLCGDHGMGPVRRRVDVLSALGAARARPGRDYVVFVNSTLALVWYLTERGRRELEGPLASIEGAHVVQRDERARLRIPMDRQWGDDMLAADPGVLFWPDYFHVKDSHIVGMHGYLDKREETNGFGSLTSTRSLGRPRSLGLRPLVDVFPTLCTLLGVRTPQGQEGRSLLNGGASLLRKATPAPAPLPLRVDR